MVKPNGRTSEPGRQPLTTTLRFISISLATTLLLFVSLNLALWGASRLQTSPPAPNEDFEHAFRLAYPELNEEDLRSLQEESTHSFQPSIFAQPREEPFRGKFVHISSDGYRHGISRLPWPPRDDDFVVFLYGGSTAFGYGVADKDTIASALEVRLSSVIGSRVVRVYNFARGGYYSTQERVQFDHMLTLGPRPDLAIFIDGLNEFTLPDEPPTFTQYETEKAAEDLHAPIATSLRQLPLFRFLNPAFEQGRFVAHVQKATRQGSSKMPLDQQLSSLTSRFLANQSIIRALGKAYGVTTAFAWQPIPVYRYDLRYHPAWSGLIGKRHQRGYRLMRNLVEEGSSTTDLIWCADIQDGVQEPLYVDHVHYNPRMSGLVADCIVEGLQSSGLIASALVRKPSPFDELG